MDFQFFHGILIPYLHYIPYRVFGGGFTASEVSRQLISTLSAPLLLLAFFRVYTNNWRKTLALSTIVMAVTIVLGLHPIFLTINSLLGLRSTFASLVAVIWVLPIQPRLRSLLTGVAIGGSVLLGTEQGLAVMIAFVIVNAIVAVRISNRSAHIAEVTTALIVAVLTVAGVGLCLGGLSGLHGILAYNLKLVPMDQYWYLRFAAERVPDELE